MPQVSEIQADVGSSEGEVNFKDEAELIQLSPEQSFQLEKTKRLFPNFVTLGLGKTSSGCHVIDTGNAVPIKSRHYPLSPVRQEEVYKELDRMLELGVIEVSNSPWSCPVVLVRKPGKVRLCLDFRKVNAVTVKDAYPLPHIEGLISRIKDTHFITGIDLKDAYWQIPLDEKSRDKTAFAVPGRPLYQFKVMPFGLSNAGQTMSRVIDQVVPSSLRDNVFVYLDDLLICTADFDSHIRILNEVAACLRRANLTINLDKSKFCMREIKYLGYIVGQGTLKTNPDKVEAMVNFPVPTTIRQVRRFLGLTGWYRRFIKNYSDLAAPLTDCLKKKKKFELTPEALEGFNKLKAALSVAPVLSQPDFIKPFTIQCDASSEGVGGVLFQLDENNNEKPLAFMSKKLNKAQKNYTVTEQECLAAVLSIRKFRPYVNGLPFKVITDHSSLKWLMSMKELSERLARWSLELQGYDFSIEHRKGSLKVVPDALSRMDMEEISAKVTVGENELDEFSSAVICGEIDLDSVGFDSEQYTRLKEKHQF